MQTCDSSGSCVSLVYPLNIGAVGGVRSGKNIQPLCRYLDYSSDNSRAQSADQRMSRFASPRAIPDKGV